MRCALRCQNTDPASVLQIHNKDVTIVLGDREIEPVRADGEGVKNVTCLFVLGYEATLSALKDKAASSHEAGGRVYSKS